MIMLIVLKGETNLLVGLPECNDLYSWEHISLLPCSGRGLANHPSEAAVHAASSAWLGAIASQVQELAASALSPVPAVCFGHCNSLGSFVRLYTLDLPQPQRLPCPDCAQVSVKQGEIIVTLVLGL